MSYLPALSLNPLISVHPINQALTPSTVSSETVDISTYNLVIDCTDNASTRYLLNDVCVKYGKTLLSGAAIRQEGWVVVWRREIGEGQSFLTRFETSTEKDGS
jgi:adenylyltransferase and sulfurtransferase